MKMGKILTLIFLLVLFFSCVESDLPKQNGFLRIEFKEPSYSPYNKKNTPFKFYYNSSSVKLNQANDDQKIIELLEDISRDLMNYDLEFRIQELESKFSVDMSETTFNELKELKKKQNLN